MSEKSLRNNISNYYKFKFSNVGCQNYQKNWHFNAKSKINPGKSHFIKCKLHFKFNNKNTDHQNKKTKQNCNIRDFKTKSNIIKNSDDNKKSDDKKLATSTNIINLNKMTYIKSMYHELPLFDNSILKNLTFKRTFFTSIAAFALITYDIFLGNNFVSNLDTFVEQWIHQNIPEMIQSNFFDKFISSLFLVFPLVTWFSLNLIHIKNAIKKSKFQIITKNVIRDGEMAIVIGLNLIGTIVLKNLLKRERPRIIELSVLSYPSIHTFMAVLLTGLLIYIKLPQVFGYDYENQIYLKKNLNYIWIASGIITALGRVLSNSHWLSDTVAGGLLGVSVTVIIISVFKKGHVL